MSDLGNASVFFEADASNASGTLPTWAEGMPPSQLNDSARALQGALKRDWDRRNPTISSTGSTNAYVLTYSVNPAALYNGERYSFEANFTNTGASTATVTPFAAKSIKFHSGGNLYDLPPNTIYTGDHVDVIYELSSDVFILQSPLSTREILVKKATAETVNNSATLQNDDELFFAVAANLVCTFEFSVLYTTAGTADFKFDLDGPAAPTSILYTVQTSSPADYTSLQSVYQQNRFAFNDVIIISGDTISLGYFRIFGVFANGANAGTLRLRWAQAAAVASDTIVRKGSILKYSVIP